MPYIPAHRILTFSRTYYQRNKKNKSAFAGGRRRTAYAQAPPQQALFAAVWGRAHPRGGAAQGRPREGARGGRVQAEGAAQRTACPQLSARWGRGGRKSGCRGLEDPRDLPRQLTHQRSGNPQRGPQRRRRTRSIDPGRRRMPKPSKRPQAADHLGRRSYLRGLGSQGEGERRERPLQSAAS